MHGIKLLTAILIAGGMTINALIWKGPIDPAVGNAANIGRNRMDKFVYPGSQVISKDGYLYVMIAEATLEDATDWYSNVFDENRMKDKNVIRSDANGDKVNLLIGSGLSGEVDVAIKEEGKSLVTIAVTDNTVNSQEI